MVFQGLREKYKKCRADPPQVPAPIGVSVKYNRNEFATKDRNSGNLESYIGKEGIEEAGIVDSFSPDHSGTLSKHYLEEQINGEGSLLENAAAALNASDLRVMNCFEYLVQDTSEDKNTKLLAAVKHVAFGSGRICIAEQMNEDLTYNIIAADGRAGSNTKAQSYGPFGYGTFFKILTGQYDDEDEAYILPIRVCREGYFTRPADTLHIIENEAESTVTLPSPTPSQPRQPAPVNPEDRRSNLLNQLDSLRN